MVGSQAVRPTAPDDENERGMLSHGEGSIHPFAETETAVFRHNPAFFGEMTAQARVRVGKPT